MTQVNNVVRQLEFDSGPWMKMGCDTFYRDAINLVMALGNVRPSDNKKILLQKLIDDYSSAVLPDETIQELVMVHYDLHAIVLGSQQEQVSLYNKWLNY